MEAEAGADDVAEQFEIRDGSYGEGLAFCCVGDEGVQLRRDACEVGGADGVFVDFVHAPKEPPGAGEFVLDAAQDFSPMGIVSEVDQGEEVGADGPLGGVCAPKGEHAVLDALPLPDAKKGIGGVFFIFEVFAEVSVAHGICGLGFRFLALFCISLDRDVFARLRGRRLCARLVWGGRG